MKIEFRQAGPEDIDLLIELYNSAFRDDYLRYGQCPAYGRTRESMEQSLRDYPKTIAYDRDRAVGLISYGPEGPGKYYIGCLGVRKEEQGRGIGTLLMNHFLEEHPDWKKAIEMPDGAIPALPNFNLLQSNNAMWINTDWLKKLGLEVPRTAEE